MPRAPSEKKSEITKQKTEAEKLFKKGMKLVDIARKLDIPEGTVRSWKSRGKWEDKSSKKTYATLQKKVQKKMQRCKRESVVVSPAIKILRVPQKGKVIPIRYEKQS